MKNKNKNKQKETWNEESEMTDWDKGMSPKDKTDFYPLYSHLWSGTYDGHIRK